MAKWKPAECGCKVCNCKVRTATPNILVPRVCRLCREGRHNRQEQIAKLLKEFP